MTEIVKSSTVARWVRIDTAVARGCGWAISVGKKEEERS